MSDTQAIRQGQLVSRGDSLSVEASQLVVGGATAGAKSFVLSNLAGSLVVAANPTANRTMSLPDADGTIALVSQLPALSAASSSVSGGTVVFSNANNMSFGLNGSTVTASSSAVVMTIPSFESQPARNWGVITHLTDIESRPIFTPFVMPFAMTLGRIVSELSRVVAGSNSFGATLGIYTFVNSTQISLVDSASATFVNTQTGSVSGLRHFRVPGFTLNMTPGLYVVGMGAARFGGFPPGTTAINYSVMGFVDGTQLGVVDPGADQNISATSAVSSIGMPFLGRFTATTSALPSTVALADVSLGLSFNAPIWPYYRFEASEPKS